MRVACWFIFLQKVTSHSYWFFTFFTLYRFAFYSNFTTTTMMVVLDDDDDVIDWAPLLFIRYFELRIQTTQSRRGGRVTVTSSLFFVLFHFVGGFFFE